MFDTQEVQQVYNYFEPMIHQEDPVFTPLQWRQFAIEGTYKCYHEDMSLYQYSSASKDGSFYEKNKKCGDIHP